MKPNFALNLSHEGIVLLHKSPTRAWVEVGAVALDDPDLRDNLKFLRSTAIGLDGKSFGTKLIIPNSQILYREVDAPAPEPEARIAQIAAALDGQLPYPVAELAFDWRDEGDHLMVAIVARETLEEAENFAVEHRFNPISFTAIENDAAGAWEPFFGRTDYSYAILEDDADVRENIPVMAAPQTLFADVEDDGDAEDQLYADTDYEAEPGVASENFFSETEEAAAGADGNIFAEDIVEEDLERAEFAPEVDPGLVSEEPSAVALTGDAEVPEDAPDSDAEVPIETPAFSSRRSIMTVSGGDASNRPLNRLAPRIALSEAETTEGAEGPVLSQEDLLRAEMLREAEKGPSALSRMAANVGPLLAAAKSRALGVVSSATAATGPLAARGLSAVKGLKLPSFSRKKPADSGLSGDEAAVEFEAIDQTEIAESLPQTTAPADGTLEAAFATPFDEAPAALRRDLKPLVAAALIGVLVAGGGLWLAFSGGDDAGENTDLIDQGDIENAGLTTSAERGVRLDNPARPRPSDFAAIVAASLGDTTVTNPERPARRSLLEGDEDPDLGKPDTAEAVSELSEEELADIRRAGAPVPTAEEIAEEDDDSNESLFSEEELAVLYAESGILQEVRGLSRPGSDLDRDDIFVAQPDRDLEANDAIILPDFNDGVQDDPPRQLMSPVPPGIVFDIDDRGFVRPTAEGALNPDGVLVRAGRPDVRPPEKPAREELVPPNPLAALTPKPRPTDLKTGADAIFVQGRMTLTELQATRARHRPESIQLAEIPADATPSELAVLASFQPARRPSDFADTVEKTRIQLASASPATGDISRESTASVDTGPALPTRASVAKTATIRNAINLSKINLIGVYGSPSKRSALLRLPSGRYVKVKIGDRIDGGRVAAISENTLSYVKSGRNRVLKVPN